MIYRNDSGTRIGSLANAIKYFNSKNTKIRFLCNGGMYNKSHAPVGLYIENGQLISPLDTQSGLGNFYLQPNGVFGIDNMDKPFIVETKKIKYSNAIKYATQSGPMLLVNGAINKAFNSNSTNKYIRNGVGILPNKQLIFVISTVPVSFYALAKYFKDAGCDNALYLDGHVSRAYCPSENLYQKDGDFGVIVGVCSL